jgi:hypothetical protein
MNTAPTNAMNAHLRARGDLLNALVSGLESIGLDPEPRTVDEHGLTVVVGGRVTRILFQDCGHYLEGPDQSDDADTSEPN